MLGDALVATSIVALGLMALVGATLLSWWLSDRTPLAGLAFLGVGLLLLCGLWLRSVGI
jgi:Na+/phosphate symporter